MAAAGPAGPGVSTSSTEAGCWTSIGRAAADAVRGNGESAIARTEFAGISGGMRTTTVVPDAGGGCEKSPAKPAKNETALTASEATQTRSRSDGDTHSWLMRVAAVAKFP